MSKFEQNRHVKFQRARKKNCEIFGAREKNCESHSNLLVMKRLMMDPLKIVARLYLAMKMSTGGMMKRPCSTLICNEKFDLDR